MPARHLRIGLKRVAFWLCKVTRANTAEVARFQSLFSLPAISAKRATLLNNTVATFLQRLDSMVQFQNHFPKYNCTPDDHNRVQATEINPVLVRSGQSILTACFPVVCIPFVYRVLSCLPPRRRVTPSNPASCACLWINGDCT